MRKHMDLILFRVALIALGDAAFFHLRIISVIFGIKLTKPN